jgi:hypothetical protein
LRDRESVEPIENLSPLEEEAFRVHIEWYGIFVEPVVGTASEFCQLLHVSLFLVSTVGL